MVKAFKLKKGTQSGQYTQKSQCPLPLPLTQRTKVAPALLAGAPKKLQDNPVNDSFGQFEKCMKVIG